MAPRLKHELILGRVWLRNPDSFAADLLLKFSGNGFVRAARAVMRAGYAKPVLCGLSEARRRIGWPSVEATHVATGRSRWRSRAFRSAGTGEPSGTRGCRHDRAASDNPASTAKESRLGTQERRRDGRHWCRRLRRDRGISPALPCPRGL